MSHILFLTPRLDSSLGRLAEHAARACSNHHDCCVLPTAEYMVNDVGIPDACKPVDLVSLFEWHSAWSVLERVTREQGRTPRFLAACFEGWSQSRSEETMARFSVVCSQAALVVVANDRIAKLVPPERPAVVIRDAVDVELFKPMPLPAMFRAGWVGNSRHCLGEVKGADIMRAACMMAGVPKVTLDTAAAGSEVPHDKMPDVYAPMSVYVCASSEHEGGPVPPLEAAAMGRLVISTRCGAMEQFVTQAMGRLVDRTPEAIAAALRELREMPREKLEAMGVAARERALAWSWEHRAPEWAAAIDQALTAPLEGRPHVSIRGLPEISPLPEPDGRLRVALVADVRDWAFDVNLRDLAAYVPDVQATHLYVVERQKWPSLRAFDRIFLPYHRWELGDGVPWERCLGSLRAMWFDPATAADPGPEEWMLVNKYHQGFHFTTLDAYEKCRGQCPRAVYLTNPVNTRTFCDATPVDGEVVASWTGNSAHKTADGRDCKGLQILRLACLQAGVPLQVAEYNTSRLPHASMPAFYARANVTLCASLYEGASNSVMEAMACGHAIIATDVGNHREMAENELEHFGDSGIMLVDRTPQAFVRALTALKHDPVRVRAMGEINREEIRQRWSWEAWAERYRAFLVGDGKRYAEDDVPPSREFRRIAMAMGAFHAST